jgi:predicted nucleic acid-binding protein
MKLYVETSVWNFLFADDAPEKKKETIRFFEEVKCEDYELYISELVIAEIERAGEFLRHQLLGKIDEIEPEVLSITEEVDALALRYAAAHFLTEKAFDDLTHVAVATVNRMDFLVSWNLKHIVKVRTMAGINEVNLSEGYRELKICTVQGVINDE